MFTRVDNYQILYLFLVPLVLGRPQVIAVKEYNTINIRKLKALRAIHVKRVLGEGSEWK